MEYATTVIHTSGYTSVSSHPTLDAALSYLSQYKPGVSRYVGVSPEDAPAVLGPTVDDLLSYVRADPNPRLRFRGLDSERHLTTFPDDWCCASFVLDDRYDRYAHGPTMLAAMQEAVRLIETGEERSYKEIMEAHRG